MKKSKLMYIVFSMIFVVALAINLTSMNYNSVDISKISENLLEKMNDNHGRLSVSIWRVSPNIDNEKRNVWLAMDSLLENTEQITESNISVSSVFAFSNDVKMDYRTSVSQIYVADNASFTTSYLNEDTIIYVSRYAPMVIANLTNEEILNLSNVSDVISLDYYEEPEFDIPPISAYTNADSQFIALTNQLSSHTGSGINIGVYDVGVPNESETEGMNVIATLGSYNGTHPGFIADILSEIAPNANYYFAGNATGKSMFECVEWLLGQGVDVINMSMVNGGDGSSNYGNSSRWFDHIAYNHYVLLVKSAGNTSGVVSCPGMAYNVMTVGSMQQNGNVYSLANFSGYYTGNTLASKPDICAVGPAGTSEAAPRVTATAALLMEEQPLLTYSPELIKAIMAASVDTNTSHHYLPTQRSNVGLNYMQAGAGLLSTVNALDVEINNQSRSSNLSADHTEQTYTFTISSDDVGSTVRIAMAFTVPVDIAGNHEEESTISYTIPNLDLSVFTPNTTVASWISATTNNNIEIVEFIPQVAGTYTIKVASTSEIESGNWIYYGVAWSIQ